MPTNITTIYRKDGLTGRSANDGQDMQIRYRKLVSHKFIKKQDGYNKSFYNSGKEMKLKFFSQYSYKVLFDYNYFLNSVLNLYFYSSIRGKNICLR